MSARAALVLVLMSWGALATPSGRRWALSTCTSNAQCLQSERCSGGRCYPTFSMAATIDNRNTAVRTRAGVTVTYQDIITATLNAWDRWTTPNITTCSTSWDVISLGTYTTPVGSAAISGTDATNRIMWHSGSAWVHGSGTLGVTTTAFSGTQLVDGDTEMNNSNINWASNGDAQSYDYESVILHEAGHFAGVNHTASPPTAVMNPSIGNGVQLRQLQQADRTDICSVYGNPGGQGESCTSSATCTQGRVCEGASSGARICTQDCSGTGAACPTGHTCQTSNSGFACLPQLGAPDLCAFCTGANSCSSGICLRNPGTGSTWCSISCTTAAQCGTGYTCSPAGSGNACVPTAGCTNQCSSSKPCPPGYACTAGNCVPTGNVGDRCDVSLYCRNCLACLITDASSGAANCRQCCSAGSGTSDLCNACPTTSCPSAQTCISITDSQAQACVPTQGIAICSACTNTTECASGVCVQGRCRSTCDPLNAGGCQACMAGSPAACACSDELAREGERCGAMSSGPLKACLNGLVCSGSPTTCRRTCTANDPNSCPIGQSCQQMGSQAVCLNLADGTLCRPCASGSVCGAGLSCVGGRCVSSCQLSAASCESCVPQSATSGVCACDDQLGSANEPCGLSPELRGCVAGNWCFNGSCRPGCSPASPTTCSSTQQCLTALNGLTYCLDPMGTGGAGGGGGSGGATSGAGGGSDMIPTGSCNCSSGGPALMLWAIVALVRRHRRNR